MSTISVGQENSTPIEIYYEDHGSDGTADRIVPFPVAGKRMPEFVKDCRVWPVEGAPHDLNWTHASKVNPELVHFLGGRS